MVARAEYSTSSSSYKRLVCIMVHYEKLSKVFHDREHEYAHADEKDTNGPSDGMLFKREAYEDRPEAEEQVAHGDVRTRISFTRLIAIVVVLLMSYRILYVWPADSESDQGNEKRLTVKERAIRILKKNPLIGETSLGKKLVLD